MQINISYTLYTDGDYSLRNAEDFGCTNRDVVVDDLILEKEPVIKPKKSKKVDK